MSFEKKDLPLQLFVRVGVVTENISGEGTRKRWVHN